VFVVNALILSIVHIHKMYYYYGFWGAEISQVFMMNFTKLSALAINYRDGGMKTEKQKSELR